MTTSTTNPFSPDYVSQIVPFKPAPLKRPLNNQPLPTGNIAPLENGKRDKLRRGATI